MTGTGRRTACSWLLLAGVVAAAGTAAAVRIISYDEPDANSPSRHSLTLLSATGAEPKSSGEPDATVITPALDASPQTNPVKPMVAGLSAKTTRAPFVTATSDAARTPSANTTVPPATTILETVVAVPERVFVPEPVRISSPATPSASAKLCGIAIS